MAEGSMNLLEKKEHYILLFDFYGQLLTEKQQEYFKYYYFDDMSLAEIANYYNVSRNAIFDQIQKTHKILDHYEMVLKLYDKYQKRNELYEQYNSEENQKLINELKELE